MKVLFIGGTGTISHSCSKLALEKGFEVSLLNRGKSTLREPLAGAELIFADIRKPETVRQALGDRHFDVIVEFLAFNPNHIEIDLELFRGRTNQYIFISSASAYQTPPEKLPVTEETPLENPVWQYSRDKAACEARLMRAYREEGFRSQSYALLIPTTRVISLSPGAGALLIACCRANRLLSMEMAHQSGR